MKNLSSPSPRSATLALALVTLIPILAREAAAAAQAVQAFNLRQGWNAIWLEVEPADPRPEVVFRTVPIASVWTFQRRLTAVDYIASPTEPIWNRDQWLLHVPTNRLQSLDNNLGEIHGGRAYLVLSDGPGPLIVSGRPVNTPLAWAADAYNLRGFPIDPGAEPSFRDFFRPSPAHADPATGRLQPIYRLNAGGTWELVQPGDAMNAGVAYWVYAKGASDYVAPFRLQFESGDSVDFGRALDAFSITLVNQGTQPVFATVSEGSLPSAGSALSYQQFNPTVGVQWPSLPAFFPMPLEGGAQESIRFGFRRQQLGAPNYETLMEVRDNAGTRYRFPVTGERYANGSVGTPGAVPATVAARNAAGLWAGTITMNAVSEVHSGTLSTNSRASDGTPLQISRNGVSVTPRPTPFEFNLRLILHVDTNGQARLLREVTELWQDGVTRTNSEGQIVTEKAGSYVLVTDESKISRFKGATVRDGVRVGRRLSSVGFDFPVSAPSQNYLTLSGLFAGGQSLSGSLQLAATHPTNPFRHQYHPDHDNLAADFRTFKEEAYPVARAFTLDLAAADPNGATDAPDYGYSVIAGTFRETVTGLHRQPIQAQGTFRLKRIAEIDQIDP